MVLVPNQDDLVCGICGRRIERGDELVGFPAFLGPHHRLAMYSDAAFHRGCIEATADGREALELYARYRSIWETRPRDLRSPAEMERWGREAFKEFL